MTEQEKSEHIGVIKVSRKGFNNVDNYLHDILNIDNTDIQGKLRDDGVFPRMHQLLMLPESYKIIAIICDGPMQWKIFVESDIIPPVENAAYPEVSPTYQRNNDGSISLFNIEIITRQRGLTLDKMLSLI